jgi:D-alanine-D-alanine ligase
VTRAPLDIGLAFDLKADFAPSRAEGAKEDLPDDLPDDLLEEYDSVSTVDAIESALASRGHRVRRLGGGRSFVSALLEAPPGLVFNIAEGRGSRSREAHVPAVCEMLGVPCTHSDPLTMAATLDKAVAKRIVAGCGVATPDFAVVESERDLERLAGTLAALGFPLFAKPLFEGSSMGIRRRSRIADAGELRARVLELLRGYREPVLVEEYCPGAEFTVGILGHGAAARPIATMEVVPLQVAREDFVYSLEVKRNWNWSEEVEYQVPPRRPAAEVAEIERVAVEAYRALGCRDVARVDLRCDREGEPRFIECNPLPGVAPGWSDLSILWDRTGRTYDELVLAILDETRARLGI